jgi:hypothetical protein
MIGEERIWRDKKRTMKKTEKYAKHRSTKVKRKESMSREKKGDREKKEAENLRLAKRQYLELYVLLGGGTSTTRSPGCLRRWVRQA